MRVTIPLMRDRALFVIDYLQSRGIDVETIPMHSSIKLKFDPTSEAVMHMFHAGVQFAIQEQIKKLEAAV